MKLIFCGEGVFLRYNNQFYASSASWSMTLWERYLAVFDHLDLIVRVEETDTPNQFPIDSKRVSIIPLPRYKGMKGAIKASFFLKRLLKSHAIPGNAYILRVPGQIGSTFSRILRSKGIKYAVEVVGDPWDVMECIGGKLSFILKRIGFYQLRYVVKHSSVSLYVTQTKLQSRYPSAKGVETYGISDVKISNKFIRQTPHQGPVGQPVKLLSVGSLDQFYKAPDIVIEALALLKQKGVSASMVWLGGGKHLTEMVKYAEKNNVSDIISFYGNVDIQMVEQCLENADIFIHISRTEGLPRAIIEAMAKGLPIIGSNVGGIPELLTPNAIIPVNNATALANKVVEILSNPKLYDSLAIRNLQESRKYEESILAAKRSLYFKKVLEISQKEIYNNEKL